VPTFWNVKAIVWPVPSGQVPPLGGSSAHEYVHGAAAQVEADASNCTVEPGTGADGESVNDAVGAAESTTGDAAEAIGVPAPPALNADSITTMACPASEAVSMWVWLVAPEIGAQLPPVVLQSSHW
jgi:hypothetical protein